MKGRNNQLVRALLIKQLLETSRFGLTTKELHSRLIERGYGATVRTIYRDIEALSEAGVWISSFVQDDLTSAQKWIISNSQNEKSVG